jgi:hypothetical protein
MRFGDIFALLVADVARKGDWQLENASFTLTG